MNEETTTILIDTALASGSASALDPEERALQELVLAVRDDAPVPAGDFRLRMDAKVGAGFPRPARSRRGFSLPSLRGQQLAALGVGASLLIALVVVAQDGSKPQSQAESSSPALSEAKKAPASPSAGETGAADSGAGGAALAAPAAPAVKSHATAQSAPAAAGQTVLTASPRRRRVEQSAALTLAAPKDKRRQVGDQVVAVTDRYRGFVLSSSVTSAGDEGGGSFDLRIPVSQLQPALRDLSALADVQSRTENQQDVTAAFSSARTRIQELTALRSSLLKQLAAATTDRAANVIRYRIRLVNARLDSETRSLTQLRRRTDYATVSVTLATKQGGSAAPGGIHKGLRGLRDHLVDAANISLQVLGVALPIALLLALLWFGGSRLDRRRREAVLDA